MRILLEIFSWLTLYGGGKGGGSAPPPPDYRGAAQEQSAATQQMATSANWANRPNVNTPWGQQTWSSTSAVDPSTGQPVTQWTQNIKLTQAEQQALNAQQAIQAGRSGAAQQLLGQATEAFQTPFNWGSVQQGVNPDAPGQTQADLQSRALQSGVPVEQLQAGGLDPGQLQANLQGEQVMGGPGGQASYMSPAGEAIYQQQLSKIEPMLSQQEEAQRTRLANMGLTMGSEAYNREMQASQANRGEQYRQAALSAFTGAGAEAQRMQGMDLASQQAANAAAGQRFGQSQAQQQAYNQALQNQFGMGLQAQQAYNQALQGQFGMNLQQQQAYNQAQQGQFAMDAQQQAAYNQAQGQQFQQGLQYSDAMNQIRQQQIGEEAQRRGMTLNELNALLTGQQVNMPNMPSFQRAQAGQAPDYLGAAQMQGQYGLGQAGQGGGGMDWGSAIGGVASVAAVAL